MVENDDISREVKIKEKVHQTRSTDSVYIIFFVLFILAFIVLSTIIAYREKPENIIDSIKKRSTTPYNNLPTVKPF